MKFDDYSRIIDQYAPTTRMLYLSCAYEPLVTPNFSSYLKYAKIRGIPHVSFCTNGLLMNQTLIHTLIKYKIDEIILSFNGFCKKDYHRIMSGSDFNTVCRNLKYLAAMKKKYHSDKPKIRMNTMLLNSNLSHLDELFEMAQKYDIDLIQFRTLRLHNDINNPEEVQRELPENKSGQEYMKMLYRMQNLTKKFRQIGKKIILPDSVFNKRTPAFSTEAAAEIHPNFQNKNIRRKRCCSVPFFSYWIDFNGNVKVCGYDENGLIGNALTDSPDTLSANKKKFRKCALFGKCKNQDCTININTSKIV
jgi:MoaA/NifB/PqqE/SkfB family radical SAM enzyme